MNFVNQGEQRLDIMSFDLCRYILYYLQSDDPGQQSYDTIPVSLTGIIQHRNQRRVLSKVANNDIGGGQR